MTGPQLINLPIFSDPRGSFIKAFDSRLLSESGITFRVQQSNLVINNDRGTLRGLHSQAKDSAEAKFVRVVHGSIYDVIVDIRPASESYLQHKSYYLSQQNNCALYIPRGFAHGYQTLEESTIVSYASDNFFSPASEVGYRYDDPVLAIEWPLEVASISAKDLTWPLLSS
jgi:dTDP-4-dehydrorhamnose 3,5-epimerase